MNRLVSKIVSFALSAAVVSSIAIIPSVSVSAAGSTPIVAGDTIKDEWKLSFGTAEKDGYIHVPKSAHPVMGDLETGAECEYGFVGTHDEDFNFPSTYDAFAMVKGHVTKLKETVNGVGSVGSKAGTDGFDYPLRFAMNCETGDYFRVALTLTNLDDGDAEDVTVFSERQHVVISHETIKSGEKIKLEFSVDVEPVYFKSEGRRFIDDMLNISVAGRNVALKDMTIQKVKPGTTVWVLGDSTVTDGLNSLPFFNLVGCTGTGASLSKYLAKDIAVSNQGEGGLNAWDNQHFAVADENIKQGDYMYVQYGHNHKNDGVHGYVCALDKYYQTCKREGATLVIVSPIERHLSWQFHPENNEWTDSLAGFARAGKGYVDCMIYGGEEAAAEYAKTYDAAANADADGDGNADGDAAGEKAAEAYKETVLAKNSTERKVTNIAFVDMNTHALGWLASISKEGTVMGQKLTSDMRLVDYYYQDGTHPNALGSQGLVEGMFLNSQKQIREYPALRGLLETYEGNIPADNSTASGRRASKVPQRIMDITWAHGDGYPKNVSQYKYPTVVRKVNFNEDGSLENMEVGLQDKSIMPTYGRGIVALYDDSGKLVKMAISNATEGNGKGYVGWVDNASEPGVQTLGFEGNTLNLNDGASFKAFIWGMLDQEGYPLTMQPYTDGTYMPVEYDYLLTDDKREGAECFHYYGVKNGEDIANKNNWWSEIESKKSMLDGELWYGSFAGNGRMTHSILDNRGKETDSGIIRVDGKIRNVEGKFAAHLSLGGGNAFECFSVENSKAKDNSGREYSISKGEWTDFEYTLDIDRGESTLKIGDIAGETVKVPQYTKLLAEANQPLPFKEVDLQIINGQFELTNFAVKKVSRTENLAKHTVTAAYVSGCDSEMGAVSEPVKAAEGSMVTLSAIPKGGYRFIGWYDTADGEKVINTSKNVEIKMPCEDITLYAKFEKHEGFYLEEGFEDYTTGEKIRSYRNDKTAPPEDVALGGFIFSAGINGNNSTKSDSTISINKDGENQYMTCYAGNPSNNARGVKFTLASPIDLAEAKTANKSIAWEFDMKADENVGMTVFGKEGSNDAEIGRYPKADVTSSKDWVNVKFIFDPENKKKYLVVTGKDGVVEKVTASELAENTKFMGVNFYDYGVGSTSFDNMKIYDLGTNGTAAQIPQPVQITAPVGAVVTIAGNTYTVNETGRVNVTLIEGKYSVSATCAGYSDYSGEITIGENYAATITMEAKNTQKTSVMVNYVDTDGNELKDSYVINGELYEQDSFELTGAEHTSAIKQEKESGMYEVYLYDSEKSDSFTIDSLTSTNEINVVFTKLDGEYFEYDDFTTGSGKWGFEPGGVSIENGALFLPASGSDAKMLSEDIQAAKKLTVSFDWKSDAEIGKGRSSSFNLCDSDGAYLFSINGNGGAGVDYKVGAKAGDGTNVGSAAAWYRVVLTIDFEAGKLFGTVTNLSDNKVSEIAETAIIAKNLAKLQSEFGYSWAPQQLDNFGIRNDAE